MQTTSNSVAVSNPVTIQSLMNRRDVLDKINSCLGSEKKAAAFASSVISVASGNSLLRNCDPKTILGAAMVAATLDLPIMPTLGMAYIVPYKGQCQFQIGYRGLIELAERSGVFKNIIDEVVYEGQLVSKNKFTGEYVFDEDKKTSDRVIGYMARFDLTNGFSKTIFWTKDEVDNHARKFSQAFRAGRNTPWLTDYDAMARKTVLKALFQKYAPKSLSYALQTAISYDQAIAAPKYSSEEYSSEALDITSFDVTYDDNPVEGVTEEKIEAVAEKRENMRKAKIGMP